jgi:hypothetical protein
MAPGDVRERTDDLSHKSGVSFSYPRRCHFSGNALRVYKFGPSQWEVGYNSRTLSKFLSARNLDHCCMEATHTRSIAKLPISPTKTVPHFGRSERSNFDPVRPVLYVLILWAVTAGKEEHSLALARLKFLSSTRTRLSHPSPTRNYSV